MLVAYSAGDLNAKAYQNYVPDVNLDIKPHDADQRIAQRVKIDRLEYKNQRNGKIGNEGLPIDFLHFPVYLMGKIVEIIFHLVFVCPYVNFFLILY